MDVDGHRAPPVASTHVFHFRSYRDAARSLARDRAALQATDGLLFGRLVFVGDPRREGFTIGPVDPRRQMALCLWRDEPSLERFVQRSSIGRAWREQTDEYCELRMTPFRTHGRYRGHEPLAGLPPGPVAEGPVVVWTFANIALRNLWFFWNGIHRATRRLLSSPGLIAATAGPEHMYRGAMTLTIWEALDAGVGFAYRTQPHKQIVKEVRGEGRLIDSMFIRFQPYAVDGQWPARSRFAQGFAAFARSLERGEPVTT